MDEFESLRLKNLALLEKLKHGQSKVRIGIEVYKKNINGATVGTNNVSHSTNKKSPGLKTIKMSSGKEKLRSDLLRIHKENSVSKESSKTTPVKKNIDTKSERNSPLQRSSGKNPSKTTPVNEHVYTSDDLDGSYLGSTGSNQTRTSTPKRPEHKNGEQTPVRSILKKRRIIDENVKVSSRFEHPELQGGATPKTHLNYSYSKVDEDDLHNRLSELGNPKDEHTDSVKPTRLNFEEENFQDEKEEIHVSEKTEKLMIDPGNDRKNASIVRELTRRPTSVLYSPEDKSKAENKTPSKVSFMTSKDSSMSTTLSSRYAGHHQGQPLLGYDWIAGILDNDASVVERPDEYFEDLKEFRRVHMRQCVNDRTFSIENYDVPRPVSPKVKDPEHTCIHTYTVNERLFTEPVKVNGKNESFCPVCRDTRREPTAESPAFVRVSIPRSTLENTHRLKPHRRKSFDPIDTCALSQHCQAGWESSRPSMMPTARNIDLRNYANSWQAQHTTTLSEAEKEASSYSHGQRTTRDLLNTSLAYRLQLQNLEQLHKTHSNPPPNSTAFPVF